MYDIIYRKEQVVVLTTMDGSPGEVSEESDVGEAEEGLENEL